MIDPRYTFNDTADTRPLRVPEGVFVLRYVSSPDGLDAPEISVTVPPGSDIAVIDASDTFARRGETILGMPGDGVVLRSMREGAVLITVLSTGGRGHRQAHVGLERITNAARPTIAGLTHGLAPALEGNPSELLEILAHVAHRGDVTVKAGEWICGPQYPMAIEGLTLNWRGAPNGLEIVTTACVNARGRTKLPPTPLGKFAGSRGKAAPVVALSFVLSGPLAARYILSCEALFLGAAIVSRAGSAVDLTGPTGHEPLVGLRLSLLPAVPQRLTAAPQQPYEASHQAPFRQPVAAPITEEQLPAKMGAAGSAGRVRIFRTSRSRSALN
jgi:hypothetical protein